MYQTLFPVTHHFYPLQHHTDQDKPPFTDFMKALYSVKPEYTENLIYLHIPYCEKRCIFCPFHVRVNQGDTIYERYISALESEIERVGRLPYIKGMRFRAVYLGGGSPSLLSLRHVQRIYDALRTNFDIETGAEWTFEGEPNGLSDLSLLTYLADQGTRRLSYGIQTFDRQLRNTLNIAANLEDVLTCFERARSLKFEEVNIDMMFHLPGQTIEDLERDISEIEKYGFDSVDYYYMSYYGLPKSAFLAMEKGLFPQRPAESLRAEMNRYVRERMRELGYHHVTDHVFSRKPSGSDYYRLLWGGGFGEYKAETLGIGASARGYIAGYSYANTLAHDAYMNQVEQGTLPIHKVSSRLTDERNRGVVFFPKFFEIEDSKVPHDDLRTRRLFQHLKAAGIAREENGVVVLTEDGKDWIPNITVDLFEDEQREIGDMWLEQLNSHYSNRVTL
jgi:coproporphyrinogen III oxidase-like Fe-S oxidoreductase